MGRIVYLESFKKMPLLTLPVRSALVEVSGAKILISPGTKLERERLGEIHGVTDLVAPNLLHGGGIPKAAAIFSAAKRWGVRGLKEKRPKIDWSDELTETAWPYHKELPMIELRGQPRLNEVVFVHLESKTLIVTDLCFNVLDASGFGARLIYGMFGTYRRFGVSKLFASATKDKMAFENSLGKIFSYNFDKIAMAHGQIVESGGKDRLFNALNERGFTPRN